jgi:diaminopimelate epimerase
VGADGWYLISPDEQCDAAIHLYNSDGSEAELSGNGTRCVAALLVEEGLAGDVIRIRTGVGPRELRLLERRSPEYVFEMNMGRPEIRDEELRWYLPLRRGPLEVTSLSVGNPQCVVFVDGFPEDWATTAAEIEEHSLFPNRTNVSYVRVLDKHTIEARFYERGAGETMSSGTGSTGAAVAAIARGLARSPVQVITPAGPLDLRWEEDVYLKGPARIVARGEFYR